MGSTHWELDRGGSLNSLLLGGWFPEVASSLKHSIMRNIGLAALVLAQTKTEVAN